MVVVGSPVLRDGILDPLPHLERLVESRHGITLLQLKVLIDNGDLDDSFDVPFISFKGKDTFNSLLRKVLGKSNIPITNNIRLSAHSTRHFALSEINRVSIATPGFTASALQNIRQQIGHTKYSNQMETTYNSYIYQASSSLVALLSTDEETRSFAYTEPASLQRRFKMKVAPAKANVAFDLDNIHMFKTFFLEEFEISVYKEYVGYTSEEDICRKVNDFNFVNMKKEFHRMVLKFKRKFEKENGRCKKRRKL